MAHSRSPMTASYRRDRSYSSNNNDGHEENGCRVHVADLSIKCTKHEIEKAFEKWPLIEIWHAHASCFAFVVLRQREDAQQAISELDGRYIGDARVRVSLARPRARGAQRNFDPNMRCYQCGSRGHFSRDCGNDQRNHNKNGNEYRSDSDRRRERSPRPQVIRDYRSYSPREASPPSRENRYGYYTRPISGFSCRVSESLSTHIRRAEGMMKTELMYYLFSFVVSLKMPRSRSATPSSRRSRSPLSDHDSDSERANEYRVHIAELTPGVQESEVRKMFQRYGTLLDVWVASASCFAFVVYKLKEEAQKAIDHMDGRSFGNNRLKVTWARPRARNRAPRHDPNMRCYKCGQRGHFSRECDGQTTDRRPSRRRDNDYDQFSSSSYRQYSRSRSPFPSPAMPPSSYFRHGMPMYSSLSRRYDPTMDGYFPHQERSNGHDYRYRDRGTRLTPPSARARYNRR
ncbi:unnamed protein product [Rotaria socialis]|uniref:Uncharacterized protein n=1 Tax=Rotaria socialis TaxID=392032 RepID=A0A820CA45_9BILA|nr:unnamed protein product [Rotaria socialis]